MHSSSSTASTIRLLQLLALRITNNQRYRIKVPKRAYEILLDTQEDDLLLQVQRTLHEKKFSCFLCEQLTRCKNEVLFNCFFFPGTTSCTYFLAARLPHSHAR